MNKKELGKNQSLAREINNKIVLERLKEKPLSGTELSFDLSLSNATISSIFNSFLSINLIKKVSSDSTKGAGRKRVKYTINDDFGLVVIVSITGNSLEVVVSSLKNKTLHKVSKAIDKYDLKTIYETIFVIKDVLSMKEFRDIRLANIILSLPGLINKKTGELQVSPQFDKEIFKDKNTLLYLFTHNFNCPVYLENDSKLMTLGEMTNQSFKEHKSGMVIYVDEGIGGGIVINNNLFFGSRGYAGEFGLINVDNKPIDEFVSLRALTKIVKEKLHLNINNSELIELYKTNKDVKAIVLNSTKYLAKAIIQMIQVYDLDYYILNGRVIDFGEEYLEHIRKPIEEYNKDAKIVFSTLREEAIILGAKEIGSEFVLDHALKGLENYEKK